MTNRQTLKVKKGDGGQPHESERPPLEAEVADYMALEKQTKADDAPPKKPRKR